MEILFFIFIGVLLSFGIYAMRRFYGEFYGQTPDDYEEGFPNFELQKHLNGPMICEGVIYGPIGRVTSSFVAEFNIVWDGNTGVMDEHFLYNDGTTQDRQWIISLGEEGKFTTTASDVPGGGKGIQSGSAVQMLYDIRLPDSAGGHLLRAVDWMYLAPNGSIVNRSQFRKFGFKVAELIATIRPKETS